MIVVTVAEGCAADPTVVALWCTVVDRQAREFAAAWGVPYVPVVFFSADVLAKLEGEELTAFTAANRLLTIQDSLDVDGALGFHADVAGVIFARVLFQGDVTSVTLSHEVLEELGDPTCEDFADMGAGVAQAREACDRVEGDTYSIEADDRESMPGFGVYVRVSNYLLPSAFNPAGVRPFDRLGKLETFDGMTDGGYMIQRAADGNVVDVFAATEAGAATVKAKRANVTSRVARRTGTPVVQPKRDSFSVVADVAADVRARRRRRA